MKADHLPAGTARRPSWAASCQPLPRNGQDAAAPAPDLRASGPEKGPRAAGRAREVAACRGRPGPPKSSGGRRVGPEVGLGGVLPGQLGKGCGGRGSGPQTRPRAPRRSPAPGRPRVRRGASGDWLLSQPPLYSDSIRGSAAYARCQSPASRSGGCRPGGGERASGGRNRGSDVRGRDSGAGAEERREGGRTERWPCRDRRTGGRRGGQGGGAGGGAAARAAAAAGGAGGTQRGRPLPGTPRPGRVGQPDALGGSSVARPARLS